MIIRSLSFENYRNLKKTEISPSEGINVICGDNAQGKTNIIECIWLFTGGRSFRGAKDKELIAFGASQARTALSFYACGREQKIEISIQDNKRSAALNGIPKSYMSQIIGNFCAVIFSPHHLALIKSGPEDRRNFTDAAICQIRPAYASVLNRYKKTLLQRNSLLKNAMLYSEPETALEIWNERLAEEGAKVAVQRLAYIEKLNGLAKSFYDGISDGKETLDIRYRRSCGAKYGMSREKIQKLLLEELISKQNEDMARGFTGSGIHRDDLKIRINERDAKSFGSQGQQRSAVLSMKLAEAAISGDENNDKPVILLDDVLSELDMNRRDYLLNRLEGFQVFITCCDEVITSSKVFRISGGAINAEHPASDQ